MTYNQKSSSNKSGKGYKSYEGPAAPAALKDRNLAATDPKKEQFEPTDAVPIRQHHRMGGAG